MKTTYADIAKKLASKGKKYQDMLDVGTKQQSNSAMLMLKEIGQRKAMLVEENNMKADPGTKMGKGGKMKYGDGGPIDLASLSPEDQELFLQFMRSSLEGTMPGQDLDPS